MKRTVLLLLAAIIFVQSPCASADLSREDMGPVLERAKKDLTRWLNAIDEDMQNAARSLSGMDFNAGLAKVSFCGRLVTTEGTS